MNKLIIYFILIVSLTACSDTKNSYSYTDEQKEERLIELKENIIGEWSSSGKQISFLEDGIFKHSKGQKLISDTYEIIDYNKIKISSSDGRSKIVDVNLNKSGLFYNLSFNKAIYTKDGYKFLTSNIVNRWVSGSNYVKFIPSGFVEYDINGKKFAGKFYCIDEQTIALISIDNDIVEYKVNITYNDYKLKLTFAGIEFDLDK